MKIALIITRLDKGGSADVVLSLFQRLTRDGYDTTLIYGLTRDYPDNFKDISENMGDKIIYMRCLRRDINPFWDIVCLFKLINIMKRNVFQIVHTHSSKAGFIGRLAAKLSGVKVIVHSPHGHIFYAYFGKIKTVLFVLLEKIAAKFTNRIITLTELGKQDHIKFGIASPGKFIPVYCGIDLNRFLDLKIDRDEERRKWHLSKDELVIGTVSRLVPIKGCEYFIKAMPGIKKEAPNTKFIIAGDGFLRQNLEKLVQDLGISEDAIFTGYQSDINRLMSIFDIYVSPSLNEGMGRCLLETQALGVPVVATNVGGVPEIVKDNKTGILVPPKSPEALMQAIVTLLKDEAKRGRMGKAAKNWIDDKFSTNRMVEKICNLYSELVKNERS